MMPKVNFLPHTQTDKLQRTPSLKRYSAPVEDVSIEEAIDNEWRDINQQRVKKSLAKRKK